MENQFHSIYLVVIVKYYFKLRQIVSLDSNKAREDTADFNSIIMVKLTQNPCHMLLSNPQLLTFFAMLSSDRKGRTSFGLKHLHSNTNLE